jgi:2-polyprenyl-3-methyl-5-hydroxy-6-metoxy-1,4-benzoquinol methylase
MNMWTWFEDDILWERLEGFLFSQFRSSETTVREAEQILGLVHPPQGAAVLDLCCGPGRHSLEFTRRGYRVTGVDRTARYLATARAAATREGLTVEFVQEDMRHFHRPAAFDLVLNLFSSFGYFTDRGTGSGQPNLSWRMCGFLEELFNCFVVNGRQ